ncbi:MAG: hypothetical protein LBQ37_02385 [Elusimicrobiota bacterium]|jgi:hypothetical protein|nr:hypothetical protein [Elusimicrobiota bacterium]
MIETILAGIGGAVVPVATNLIKGIFGVKEKKIEAQKAISDNDVKLAEIAAKVKQSDNEFEKARQEAITQTFKTGVAWVDGANGLVRVIIGLSAAAIIIASVIGYFNGRAGLLSNEDLAAVVFFVAGYYFSERSCQKVF